MSVTWNVEWLNGNANRAYPLVQSSEALIPENFLVGITLSAYNIIPNTPVQVEAFFIGGMAVTATAIIVDIHYKGASTAVAVGRVTIPVSTHTEYTVYPVVPLNNSAITGYITVSSLFEVLGNPGIHSFTYDKTAIEPDCIRPTLSGLTSVSVRNAAGGLSPRMIGDVVLEAGSNVILSAASVPGGGTIVMHSTPTADFVEDCGCGTTSVVAGTSGIMTINGRPPDSNGNFTIMTDACLSIEPSGTGIVLNNTCATSCCGCEDLAAINTYITEFRAGKTDLETFLSELSARMTALQAAVSASVSPTSWRQLNLL